MLDLFDKNDFPQGAMLFCDVPGLAGRIHLKNAVARYPIVPADEQALRKLLGMSLARGKP
jgi:hypothetical protein